MTLRLFVPAPLLAGAEMALPAGAARHAMVRRVQPGDELLLFDGSGPEWPARVLAVTRSSVSVQLGAAQLLHRELPVNVTVALVMPANERMDLLVEKATELGVAQIQPLHSERSVLRLGSQGAERAERKRAHWQAVAQAACEQCGRATVPPVAPVRALHDWLHEVQHGRLQVAPARWLLSLQPGARGPSAQAWPQQGLCTLSGPEGGFTPAEEGAAQAAGFVAVDLGPRVLRAETAPLAVLAWLALSRPILQEG